MNERLLGPRDASASASEGCAHCGTPCRGRFCCAGCETVFHLLRDHRLDDYYAFRERVGGSTEPVGEELTQAMDFDSEGFRALYCQDDASGLRTSELGLNGVHCAACVWLIERLPRILPEVREARVDAARGRVRLVWAPQALSLGRIAAVLSQLGYAPSAPRGLARDQARQQELRGLLVRMGVAFASAGNVMLMAFSLYGAGEGAQAMEGGTRRLFEIGMWLASLPALVAGSVFFRGAWASFKTRTAHMDLPIALGIGVAFAWGTAAVWFGHGALFFDSITTLIFLLLIGRYLQRRHQLSATEAAELLHSAAPAWARRVSGTEVQRVSVNEVVVGDLIRVESGEVVALDGIVEAGRSALDMSLLTGESLPVEVEPGAPVLAGCSNSGGQLLVRVTQVQSVSRIARLLASVQDALLTRTPLTTQAERVAAVFTRVILMLAALTALFWWPRGPEAALSHALALLIVACPCALAMATPLASNVAVRQAAERKILFFRGEALERLATPSHLVLDKTGTLTEGRLALTRWDGDAAFAAVARAAEGISRHPIARALRASEPSPPVSDPVGELQDLFEDMGRGITGTYRGRPLVVGSESFVRAAAHFDGESEAWLEAGPAGASPVIVAWDGSVKAIGWLEDRLQGGVAEALRQLHEQGHRASLLSGDHPRVVERLAQQLSERTGVAELFEAVQGGVGPEEKRAFIESQRGGGRAVVMVGDGVNDAAALAAADVGVAVHGAAEASRLSADVFLAAAGARDLVALMTGARATLRVIRRGMGFALLYNLVGVGLAISGQLNPLAAAVLMPLSSLTVVTNAYRSRMFSRPRLLP